MRMKLFLVVPLIFLGMLNRSSSEICRQARDCLGYVRFSGYKCVQRECTCQQSNACSGYEDAAKRENRYYCTTREDCEAFNEYAGILCLQGTCRCIKHFACGGCLPRLEVLRMARHLNETCIFDQYGNHPFWTIYIGTDMNSLTAGEVCSDLQWKVSQTVWKIYKITHSSNFEILEENHLNTQVVAGRYGNLDDFSGKHVIGLFAIQVNVHVTSGYGYNERFDLTGYFADSCAKSYNETQDMKYHPSDPVCDIVNQEVIHIGSNYTFNYSYELPCPSGCDRYLNPQVLTEFTVDIGCSYTIKQLELTVRNCDTDDYSSCYYSSEIRDRSTLRSVQYKPRTKDRVWKYHGLFVRVYVTTANFIQGHQLVQYGPIPAMGSCAIIPSIGHALTTWFNLTCTGFSIGKDQELRYAIFTNHENNFKKATRIYFGTSPNRSNMLLQQGKKATDYTVYIWVKAAAFGYGAFVLTQVQAQVHPPEQGEDGKGVVDLAEGFLSVEEGRNSSLVQDLILQDAQEATQLLGVITSSLNVDESETDGSTDESAKKTQVRTEIVTVLKEIPVGDIETVSTTVNILNAATEVKEEISQDAQDAATDLYVDLADNFDNFVEGQPTEEVTDIAGSLLNGVTRILDINLDSALKTEQIQLLAQSEVGAPTGEQQSMLAVQNSQVVEKMKNSTVKLLGTVDRVSNTLVDRQPQGANSTIITTDTMTVGIQKMSKKQLSTASYTAAGTSNSSGSFKFPDIAGSELSDEEHGVKMLYMDKNPYVWAAAKDITSPVMSVSLNANNTEVDVHDLKDPITVSLSTSGGIESSETTFRATVVKKSGNVTLDETKSNIVSFNISGIPDRTICLSVVSLRNITSFKMLIKTTRKPSLDEIIEAGFLYPEEIPQDLFADFNHTDQYIPISDDERRRLYITPTNPLSSGNFSGSSASDESGAYYVGLTLDLTYNETLKQLEESYPSCLGSEQTDCSEVVEMTIQIQTSQLGCFYWDLEEDSWSSQGCEVSPYSTNETIECLCTHLTSFSGSIIVLPNMVDPLDFELFLTFFDNPVVVTAVIIVWVVYFFIIHWARQADKKDLEKVGVMSCPDNNPNNNYMYLVCAVTGWWKNAGTTANIFIFLKGSKGQSSNHCLTASGRQCFQSGSEDWFLITTEQSLGNLQSITLWHDNIGTRPHWYLNHVYVKDIQLRKSWHFIFNDWLSVDRGHMLQTSATIEAVTEEELKFKQKHNFMVKSTQDLRDGHLWLSIFSKPAKSTFTRVQRLSCALSLLLTTMLTNIMFYGIPTDDPEDQAAVAGNISISLSAIIIGIESSIIMFPINLIILQFFLKVKPKPWSRTVMSSLEKDINVQKVYDVTRRMTDRVMRNLLKSIIANESITNSCGHSSVDQNNGTDLDKSISIMAKESLSSGKWSRGSSDSFKDNSQSEERNPSIVSLKSGSTKALGIVDPVPARKNPKVLPWWFLYIAWFLVISTSLISSYFVMLYGLKYGYNKSVSWIVSFLTGFTQSAFVTQPLKVICIAVIITLIFKKPAEFDDFGPDVELDKDEVYQHEVCGAKEIHHPTVEPLSNYFLRKLRERLYLEWLMDMTIRDLMLYLIYMAVVLFMVHGHRNVSLAYQNTAALERLLLRPSCTEEDCVSFEDANTVEGMFDYLDKVLVPLLTDMSQADHDSPSPGSNHFLLGPFRLRQQRVKKGSCHSSKSSLFRRFGHDLPECVASYSFDIEDTGSYNNSWKNPDSQTSPGSEPWSYRSSWQLSTIPYTGNHATYSGGGFVLELPFGKNPTSQLNKIRATDWVDDHTRAIFVEFTLYNPNVDLFSVVLILFEFSNSGGVFQSQHIFTAKLDHYSSAIGPYVAVCEVLFLLFNIAFTYIQIRRYKKAGRKEYFEDKWSFAEILQIGFAYTVIGLFLQRLVLVNTVLQQYRNSDGSAFISFYAAVVSDQILGIMMAFLAAVVIVKAIKPLQFNKKMFMLADTMAIAKIKLFNFAIMFVIAMVAFAHFTTLAFGSFLSVYQSFGTSLETLFQFALDTSDIVELNVISPILGPLYFVSFIVFSKWCLVTIFIAILNFGISDSKAKTAQRRNKFEIVDYITGKVKDLL